MKKNNVKVSVLMACYNASKYIKNTIYSVLSQTYEDFEFVIVDDGSKDNTVDIIKKIKDIDGRIILIEKKHSGLANSLNVGIKASKGDWIARIDADDICRADRLNVQFDFANNTNNVVFVGSDCIEFDCNSYAYNSIVTKYPVSNSSLVNSLQTVRKFPPHSSAFFLKSAAMKVGCYRERFKLSQDRDLWLRLSEVGSIFSISKPLVLIRNHGGQLSKTNTNMHQKIYAIMATVSYFIRKDKITDPLNSDKLEYIEFEQWLWRKLKQKGVVDRVNIVNDANNRSILFSRSQKVLFYIKHVFTQPPSLFTILKDRFFGSKIPFDLSIEWKYDKNIKS
jgi:glycosyltransferase involved in cell wall biosynthesis